MSSSGPWSVKGIDPRARARAKSAARREGLTLGEWINRVILDGSDPSNPEWDDALEAFPGFGGGSALNEEDDRLLRAMVNRLTERVESSEKMSARTLSGLDKAITQLADKITKTGERQTAEIASTRQGLDKVRKTQDELGDRIRSLESAPPGSGSSEDVRAVETTIMKLARRLYEHENDTAARLHAVDEDTRSASESLEARLARLESRAEDTADRNRQRDDETARSLNGLRTATETLKARVEGAERITNDAARALDSSVSRLDDRLRQLETRNSGDTVDLERRFERLSDDVARAIADTRSQVAQAVSGAASEPRIDRLEDALTRALSRMDDAERRQGDSMSKLGQEITKLAGAIDRRLTESERRAADALRESQSEHKIDRRLDEVRTENRDAIKRMGEEVSRLGRSLADRIETSEQRANSVVETATDRMAEMIEKFDSQRQSREEDLEDRLRQSEERTAKRIEDALGGVQDRMAAVRSETEEALSPVQRAMSALADRLEAIENRTAPPAGDTPEAETAAEEEIDFDTPLGPPPQAETPVGAFEPDEADPFLAEAEARPARPAPRPARRAQPQAPAQQSPAAAQAQPAAAPAPQPAQQPARKPRPAGKLGATADADFLAAARERTRSTSYAHTPDTPSRPSRLGRIALYALPVVALIMLSGAGVILVWEALQGDAERQAASAQGERDFIAQVEAGFSSETGTPAESQSVQDAPEQAPSTPDGDGTAQMAEAGTVAPAGTAPEPQRQPQPEPATPPANAVADATGSMVPAAGPDTSSAPAVSAPVTSTPANGRNSGRVTLESAASEGNPVARYQLGLQALENGDAETAAILLRRAAEQGVPAAQYRFAKLLETGEGVDQDLEAARRWTERAANAGHRRAMHNLGVMYYYGTGVAENIETAARWFQEAALLGLRDSQFNLALLYETGDGVPLSLPDAFAWFTIASQTGSDPTAGERAANVAERLEPAALEEARATAEGFTPRPIDAEANGLYRNLPWDRTATTDVAQVRRAQGFLSVLGYSPGPIDGEMGGRTRDAIMAFEADQGLPRTGRVDAVLIERLERAAAG